ncbi:TetR/AcrR family transcriptional regulator [Prolixibacteraceae bacterium Z1-6]|uniref:TetR/AcrR family transcriptional regulator n=1 Tax=Draconibacterium aestuarii TaxID=2998507 RepID=A0A9X3J614_9BACT|nr:TetR/AcrR family transcriptional regulator [Prolixibacteraceae bacterium Z1-6]
MNEIKKDNTEDKILKAAKTIFIRKGMEGARMQEIADEAGINKALLHYYFRSKQKLFEAIFVNLLTQIFPNITTLLLSDKPIEEKIGLFIEKYIDMLLQNPYLPAFVLKEINRDSDFFEKTFSNRKIDLNLIFNMLEKEMEAGNIRKMNPRDIMANLLAMCIFPFAAKPMLKLLLFGENHQQYDQFLEERKSTIKEFVLNSIVLPKS